MADKLYDLMNWPEIEAVVYSEADNPYNLLGGHACKNGFLIQVFRPDAVAIQVSVHGIKKLYQMEKVDEAGFFAVLIPLKKQADYELIIEDIKGIKTTVRDPYSFGCMLDEKNMKRFNLGTGIDAYKFMGSHYMQADGVGGMHFAVWAPNAKRVSVVGEFNRWDGRIYQMQRNGDSGIFELFIPGMEPGISYCYEVKFKNGVIIRKLDPYACNIKNDTRAVSVAAQSTDEYKWNDKAWMNKKEIFSDEAPVSICEIDIDDILKDDIVENVSEAGFNCVVITTAAACIDKRNTTEISAFFSPHLSYEKPDMLQSVIDSFHQKNIAVIMDWYAAYLSQTPSGMIYFDGSYAYEKNWVRLYRQKNIEVSTFDYDKPQVRTFLYSNFMFWLEKYHFDGMRINELASMLYLNYGRNAGEWIPNIYGGNENLAAIEFVKGLSRLIDKCSRKPLLIAEDDSGWPCVTVPVKDGGLGFDYKQNDGWKKEIVPFMELDPLFRKGSYEKLTYGMLYQYSENFILDFSRISDDWKERGLYDRMPLCGKTDEAAEEIKKENLKAVLAFMYTHPGKKLINYKDCRRCADFIKKLNDLYISYTPMYELDNENDGFEWVDNVSCEETVIAYERKSSSGDKLLNAINFTPVLRQNFRFGVPCKGKYKVVFCSDKSFNGKEYRTEEYEYNGKTDSVLVTLPPLGVICLVYEPYSQIELEEIQIKKEAAMAKEKASLEAKEAEKLKEEAIEHAKTAKEAEERAKEAAKEAVKAAKEAQKKASMAEKNSIRIDEEMKRRLEALLRKE